jgi:MFS family permease
VGLVVKIRDAAPTSRVMVVAVMVSMVAFLDSTVVNLALPAVLIAARVVQGLGAVFLVPGSLAMINDAFDKAHQSAAIGTWTAWTGTAFALGPLLGGLAVDLLSWRWIYALSAIPMVIGFALTFWMCPMTEPSEHARVDLAGGLLGRRAWPPPCTRSSNPSDEAGSTPLSADLSSSASRH